MNKKAVILGNTNLNYSWFVKTYREGLKLNGYEVFEIDYKSNSLQSIKKQLIDLKVPLIFTHLSFHYNIRPVADVLQMQRDVIKAIGAKFIHILGDARSQDRYMGDVSDAFHMAFVGNYDMVENGKKAWKIPVIYAPYSSLCYDEMAKPVKDLSFKEAVFAAISIYRHRKEYKKYSKNPLKPLSKKQGTKKKQ